MTLAAPAVERETGRRTSKYRGRRNGRRVAHRVAQGLAGYRYSLSWNPPVLADALSWVYVCWSRATPPQCLYVGMSDQPMGRVGSHLDGAWWGAGVGEVELFSYAHRDDAREAETQLINLLLPPGNTHVPFIGVDVAALPDPEHRRSER